MGRDLTAPVIQTDANRAGQFMAAAMRGMEGAQQSTKNIVDIYNAEDVKKLAAQERADRLAQQAIDNKRAEAMLAMQQNQEQRAIDALAKTEATQKAVLDYTNVLGNYGKDVVTEAQANELLAKYNSGKDVQADYAKKVAEYNASPEMKRDVLNQLVVPTEMDGKVVDPTMLINLKSNALEGQQKQADTLKQQLLQEKLTDKQIAANKDLALLNKDTQLRVAGMNVKAANDRFDKEKSWEEKKLEKQQALALQQKINDQKLWDYSAYTGVTTGNPKEVAGFIKDAKDAGHSDYIIQKALRMAPKGDSIFDIGSPEVDLEAAKDYINSFSKK